MPVKKIHVEKQIKLLANEFNSKYSRDIGEVLI